MKFVTYIATPELERLPERERFGAWCSMHNRLMRTDPDYQRHVRGVRWQMVGATIAFGALSPALGRFPWPPLVVQVSVYLVLTILYVAFILHTSFGLQQFQNEHVGKALREHAALPER